MPAIGEAVPDVWHMPARVSMGLGELMDLLW